MKKALVYKFLGIFSLVSPSLFSMEMPEPMQISTPEAFPIERLPTHLKAYFLTFLCTGRGRTRAAKLHNAAEMLRNYMLINKSFAVLLADMRANGVLIDYLARYTGRNLTQAGLALATVGARKYLEILFCGHNRWCFPIDQEINWAAAQGDDVSLNTLIKCSNNHIPTQARVNAACGGHASTIELLFTPGIHLNGDLKDKDTPLIMACRNGHTLVVQKLLEKGVDPCFISREWTHSTALFVAAEWGHLDCVNLLLATQARTQVDFQDRHNRTALMLASQRGHAQVVKVLLQVGAKVNLQDDVSSNALLHAVGTDCSSADYITIVKDLIAAGSEVNFTDIDGHTALFRSRRNPGNSPHKKEIEKILLAHDAI